jgi:hypothetical protein
MTKLQVTNQPAIRESAADLRHGVRIHGLDGFSWMEPISAVYTEERYLNKETDKNRNIFIYRKKLIT